jgi:hypothetical protein
MDFKVGDVIISKSGNIVEILSKDQWISRRRATYGWHEKGTIITHNNGACHGWPESNGWRLHGSYAIEKILEKYDRVVLH